MTRGLPALFALLLIPLAGQAGAAVRTGEREIRAEHYAFVVRLPPRWTTEQTPRSHAQAYVEDSLPGTAAPVSILTVIGAIRAMGPDQPVEAFIAGELRDRLRRAGRNTAARGPETLAAIRLSDRRSAPVVRYQVDASQPLIATALIAEEDSINLVILSSRDEAAFNAAWPDFVAVVRSYRALPLPPSTRLRTLPVVSSLP